MPLTEVVDRCILASTGYTRAQSHVTSGIGILRRLMRARGLLYFVDQGPSEPHQLNGTYEMNPELQNLDSLDVTFGDCQLGE